MTRHDPDLGSASDWLCLVLNLYLDIDQPPTLFRTISSIQGASILLPCLGQRSKCMSSCVEPFIGNCNRAIGSQSQVVYTLSTNKCHPVYNQDSLAIPCPGAHPHMGHIREYPGGLLNQPHVITLFFLSSNSQVYIASRCIPLFSNAKSCYNSCQFLFS